MNAYYLTLPVLLPIVFGLVGFALPFPSEKTRRLWFGSIICLTTVLTWVAILRAYQSERASTAGSTRAAAVSTFLPVAMSPVSEIMAMPGWSISRCSA